MRYQEMSQRELQREYRKLSAAYREMEQQGLHLDLSRGKPSPEQLELSRKMLDEVNSGSVLDSVDGTDCRNYGGLDGIPEAKALLAESRALQKQVAERFDEMRRRYRDAHPELTSRKRWADVFEQQ